MSEVGAKGESSKPSADVVRNIVSPTFRFMRASASSGRMMPTESPRGMGAVLKVFMANAERGAAFVKPGGFFANGNSASGAVPPAVGLFRQRY